MGWLVNYVVASWVLAIVAVKLYDYLFAGVSSGLSNVARATIFIGTWTLVTTASGMHGFTKGVRNLRQGLFRHLH